MISAPAAIVQAILGTRILARQAGRSGRVNLDALVALLARIAVIMGSVGALSGFGPRRQIWV